MLKVAYLVSVAKHLLELNGIGGAARVLQPITVGHGVAYTGHPDADLLPESIGKVAKEKNGYDDVSAANHHEAHLIQYVGNRYPYKIECAFALIK